MKIEIKPSGTMVISSETGLEAYALRRWREVNEGLLPPSIIIKPEFIIDCELLSPEEIKEAML
jgi:hypothetical protein